MIWFSYQVMRCKTKTIRTLDTCVFSCLKQFANFTVSFYVRVGFSISYLFSLVKNLRSCKKQTSERMIKILLTPYLALFAEFPRIK